MKIISIVGTRPQFIKLSILAKELALKKNINHIIIHSGQHYDKNMSQTFFNILDIPTPNYHINIENNKTHAEITSHIMINIEKILLSECPNYVIVYGDCDTTLAGALATSKLSKNIKLIHIEAGLRSYDKTMPEEINRILVDHVSDLLFCTTERCKQNLLKENISSEKIYVTGNLMMDVLRENKNKIDIKYLKKNGLEEKKYFFVTIHRKDNVNKKRLKYIFNELSLSDTICLLPMHPRTKKLVLSENIMIPKNIKIVDPLNYLESISLIKYSRCVITDSGGIQEEAYELNVPCITVRKNTERVETVENNGNVLIYGYEEGDIFKYIERKIFLDEYKKIYMEDCGKKVVKIIKKKYKYENI